MLYLWFAYRINKMVFRTTPAGQKLFYPNGLVGQGYILPTDQIYQRILRGYIAICIIAVILAILGVLLFIIYHNLVGLAGLLVVFMVGYMVWVRIQCHDLVRI